MNHPNSTKSKIRTVFLSISFIIAALSCSAQLEIRPFLGANFSNVSETPDGTDTKAKLGGQVGAHVMIGNQFHLYPGIAYFSRSTEFSTDDDFNTDQTVEGVILPLLVGYRFVDTDSDPFFNFRLFAGPSVMFLTTTEYDDGEFDEEVNWNSNQWGAQVGAGIDLSIFFLDVTYEFGLTNAHDGIEGEDGLVGNFGEVKQNTFLINAGIRLTLAQ
jgi:hypothetical protein